MPKFNKNQKCTVKTDQKPRNNSKNKRMKKSAIKRAMEDYQTKKEQKEQEKKKIQERRQESANAILQYKKKKIERYKNLCKKTKKGQPIMRYQIEHLLDKIEKQMETE
ncbi:thyroid transcription factor 1-associated protein 26-like [Centruroides sculpturatus]|uniref:thyroid transcription factor 1-associated protein 26-like n=1 Tax=Centruroides sculpturatus TaxID=218467 RepID=UPI000C6DC3C8|nr:thyroid transcription factor 1-associated protein 26-like [Centruroides sculpturatus]